MKKEEVTKLIDDDVEELVTKLIFVEDVVDVHEKSDGDQMIWVEEILNEQIKINEWDGSEVSSLPSLEVEVESPEKLDGDGLKLVEEVLIQDDGINEWNRGEHSLFPTLIHEEDVEGSGHFHEAEVFSIVEELSEQKS